MLPARSSSNDNDWRNVQYNMISGHKCNRELDRCITVHTFAPSVNELFQCIVSTLRTTLNVNVTVDLPLMVLQVSHYYTHLVYSRDRSLPDAIQCGRISTMLVTLVFTFNLLQARSSKRKPLLRHVKGLRLRTQCTLCCTASVHRYQHCRVV